MYIIIKKSKNSNDLKLAGEFTGISATKATTRAFVNTILRLEDI